MKLSKRVISGSIWALGARYFVKVMGAVQLFILARILVPQDFGLFAVASLTLLAFDALRGPGDRTVVGEDQEVVLAGAFDPFHQSVQGGLGPGLVGAQQTRGSGTGVSSAWHEKTGWASRKASPPP